jgi:hypothetical protein
LVGREVNSLQCEVDELTGMCNVQSFTLCTRVQGKL